MMRNILAIFTVILTVFVSGCSIPTTYATWEATGGSKSDGLVILQHERIGLNRKPTTSGDSIALQRCLNWGYTKVDPYTPTERCIQFSGYSCLRRQVTKNYQCID